MVYDLQSRVLAVNGRSCYIYNKQRLSIDYTYCRPLTRNDFIEFWFGNNYDYDLYVTGDHHRRILISCKYLQTVDR